MKNYSVLAAFLGGALIGAASGLLFAPEKGVDTRSRIAEALRKRGIKLSTADLDSLADDIAEELDDK
ncbi:YtxH domain-containing protein [Pseudoprevotella muciniphila]|uniref:YtxH domain-containing protein n=1 Tax=Pseudoprevotella muciniphila TaxID=2133944 RepID=A0A5P8E4W0_9BACT|nr:YtxH domain-containing protein [Pseudoprevotella muciniphila]MBQ7664874.1 YtxH domain-containing protein [Bacteroidaceae bacterium]QFQ11977.1 YtxH domain-containing protein [Pseudoprevotella muciniphila]